MKGQDIAIRLAVANDLAQLKRLAALDSAPVPLGPLLVAESAGELLAALPLRAGRSVADPFKPTAEATALLELRREQLIGPRSKRSGLHLRRRRLAEVLATAQTR